ncbi:hypothetical protein NUM3379_02470 [Kineococcus sp. NUM-3379]
MRGAAEPGEEPDGEPDGEGAPGAPAPGSVAVRMRSTIGGACDTPGRFAHTPTGPLPGGARGPGGGGAPAGT